MTEDDGTTAARAGALSSIVGGALATDLGSALAIHAQQRNAALFQIVAEVVDELIEQVEGLTVETIAADPVFIATAEKVVRAAQQTADDEHRARLLGALRHAGAWTKQDPLSVARMTDLLTRLGPLHIFLTRFFNYPAQWLLANGGPEWAREEKTYYGVEFDGQSMTLLFGLYVFPDNAVSPGEVGRVIDELQRETIMESTRAEGLGLLNAAMTQQEMFKPRLTDFGNRFLAFAEGELEP